MSNICILQRIKPELYKDHVSKLLAQLRVLDKPQNSVRHSSRRERTTCGSKPLSASNRGTNDGGKLKKLETIIQVLQAVEVTPIVLGDAAIALSSSTESQPSIHDYHLLIRTAERERAIATLQRHNWQLISQAQNKGYEAHFEAVMQDPQTKLNLQGQLFWAVPQDYTTEQLWETGVSCRLGEIDVLRLNFTNSFLHLCLRAFYRRQTQQISFFVDAVTLEGQQGQKVDWIELITQAQRYQTILPLRNMLTVLEQLFETPLPDWVFFALHQMPVGQKEFLRYQILPQRKRTILKSILFRTANASSLITS